MIDKDYRGTIDKLRADMRAESARRQEKILSICALFIINLVIWESVWNLLF